MWPPDEQKPTFVSAAGETAEIGRHISRCQKLVGSGKSKPRLQSKPPRNAVRPPPPPEDAESMKIASDWINQLDFDGEEADPATEPSRAKVDPELPDLVKDGECLGVLSLYMRKPSLRRALEYCACIDCGTLRFAEASKLVLEDWHDCSKYKWKQSFDEIMVSIPLPTGTKPVLWPWFPLLTSVCVGAKARDIHCDFKASTLTVTITGACRLEGSLCKAVCAGDCTWCIEDSSGTRELSLTLAKTNVHHRFVPPPPTNFVRVFHC
jgi:hypothetical protein